MRILLSSLASWLPVEITPGWQLIIFGSICVLSSIGLVHVIRCWRVGERLQAAWQWLNSPTQEGHRLGDNIHHLLVLFLTVGSGLIILKIVAWAIGAVDDLLSP